jgi:hypothetical protein
MRLICAVFALMLAGCDLGDAGRGAPGAGAEAEGYTLEIRASEVEQTYLVIAPDGRTVGARAAEGASALMESSRAQALASSPPPQGEAEAQEVMSLRLPGFEMSVSGSEENADGDNGRVNIAIGGGDGRRIVVNANEGGPGDADDRAYVRISGADAEAVRRFIVEADELSPAVQAQMLVELELEEETAAP